jgi:hypothetical protein
MSPTHDQLKRAERLLRRDDKALRLRFSLEAPIILIERKTFRGRYGSHGPEGIDWRPDAGYRRENGHVPVASIPVGAFDLSDLQASLRAADTWRRAQPLWRQAQDADDARKRKQKLDRSDNIRYKTSEFWDRYVWKQKSRVSVL